MNTSRRNFIRTSGLALGLAALHQGEMFAAGASPSVSSYGFQSWTLREEINADPEKVCSKMAEYGYSEIEMCSPLGYRKAGFEPLGKYKGRELSAIFNNSGLRCTSSHFTFSELKQHLEDRINWANELGMSQMILSSFSLPDNKQSAEDYRKAADELNLIGDKTRSAGIQMGFHNHHTEFSMAGDQLIYDVLLKELDPDLVKMQFQVAVVDIGFSAAHYFRKYPGRFISAHLADWSSEKDEQVPIGQGDVDWVDFFDAAKTGGLKNVYVEMSPDTFEPSAHYLSSL